MDREELEVDVNVEMEGKEIRRNRLKESGTDAKVSCLCMTCALTRDDR